MASQISNDAKQKLVEQLITAGGVAGVITAFLKPTAIPEALFVTAVVFFVFSSVYVYHKLLIQETMQDNKTPVVIMLGSFMGLIIGLELAAFYDVQPQQTILETLSYLGGLTFQIGFLVYKDIFADVYRSLTNQRKTQDETPATTAD